MKTLLIWLWAFTAIASGPLPHLAPDSIATLCSKNYSAAASRFPALLAEEGNNYQKQIWEYLRRGELEKASALEAELLTVLSKEPALDWVTTYYGATGPQRMKFSMEVDAIYKLSAADSARPQLSGLGEEIAAYKLSRLYGFHFVPLTIERTINGKAGSLQAFVRQTVIGELLDVHVLPGQRDKLTIFDTLINNKDRNGKNFLIDVDGYIVAIDHGVSFRNAGAGKYRIPAIDGSYFQTEEGVRVYFALKNTPDSTVRAELDGLLSAEAIDEVIERKNGILALFRER